MFQDFDKSKLNTINIKLTEQRQGIPTKRKTCAFTAFFFLVGYSFITKVPQPHLLQELGKATNDLQNVRISLSDTASEFATLYSIVGGCLGRTSCSTGT